MKFGFMAKNRGIWPLRWMCETLDVSRGGFYEWLKRPPSARVRTDTRLTWHIRTSFAQSDCTYGACVAGSTSLKLRLRYAPGRTFDAPGYAAWATTAEKVPQGIGQRPENVIAQNVLARQFEAPASNQKWVADFTYIWTAEGWLDVAVVLDLYSRRAVGWSMSEQKTAPLVTDALLMAIWRRGAPKQLLHYSYQGSQ